MIRGLLLDFYGTVVEEDDEVVASICGRAAESGPGEVSAEQVSAAWWGAFRDGMAADEVLHVGDSLHADVAGARAAGIAAVWVNRRGRPVPDGMDPASVISDLADLTAKLHVR